MAKLTIHNQRKTFIIDAEPGVTLLDALRKAALPVPAPCGGMGRCGKCLVTLTENGSSHTVLACQTTVGKDWELSLTGLSGGMIGTETQPGSSVFPGREGYGAAVDLGTTTVVVQLFALAGGTLLGTASEWNAQMAYGADVISRIQYTMEEPHGLELLSQAIRSQIFRLLDELCRENGLQPEAVREITLAGNTIMQHIFAGRDPAGIAAAPYTPQTLFDTEESALVPVRSKQPVFLAPCISGYVGGDIVAGLLSTGLAQKEGVSLFLDIGTNGEMALGGKDGFLCCSVATGPAFEGAEISCGMSSTPGAVSHVRWEDGGLQLEVIGGKAPTGLCGSGLVDLLSILLELGAVDETGRLLPPEEAPDELASFLGEDENGNGIFYLTADRAVFLSAGDVRKLQLAKASVAAGIIILTQSRGIQLADVDALYLAGGFGGHLNPHAAAVIGMLPRELESKLICVGNSSLAGARQVLLDPSQRRSMLEVQRSCRYLELSGHQAFSNEFISQMMFGPQEEF